MSRITFEQFARGIAALDTHEAFVLAIVQAHRSANREAVNGVAADELVTELLNQLEERCNDPPEHVGGSMIRYMLYEGRNHGGLCRSKEGVEVEVNSPEALWSWWEQTKTGPFSEPKP